MDLVLGPEALVSYPRPASLFLSDLHFLTCSQQCLLHLVAAQIRGPTNIPLHGSSSSNTCFPEAIVKKWKPKGKTYFRVKLRPPSLYYYYPNIANQLVSALESLFEGPSGGGQLPACPWVEDLSPLREGLPPPPSTQL